MQSCFTSLSLSLFDLESGDKNQSQHSLLQNLKKKKLRYAKYHPESFWFLKKDSNVRNGPEDEVCKYPVNLTARNKCAIVVASSCLLIPWLVVHLSLDCVPFYHI